jgi:hypothetical protein
MQTINILPLGNPLAFDLTPCALSGSEAFDFEIATIYIKITVGLIHFYKNFAFGCYIWSTNVYTRAPLVGTGLPPSGKKLKSHKIKLCVIESGKVHFSSFSFLFFFMFVRWGSRLWDRARALRTRAFTSLYAIDWAGWTFPRSPMSASNRQSSVWKKACRKG